MPKVKRYLCFVRNKKEFFVAELSANFPTKNVICPTMHLFAILIHFALLPYKSIKEDVRNDFRAILVRYRGIYDVLAHYVCYL